MLFERYFVSMLFALMLFGKSLFKGWFTITAEEVTKGKEQTLLTKRNGPIKTRDSYSTKRKVHVWDESVNILTIVISVPNHKLDQNGKLNSNANSIEMDNFNETDQELSSSRISKVYVRANYDKDRTLQKIIGLLKERNATQISRLPPPWREKFNSLSLDNNGLLYMEERLVIPKDMRDNMLSAIHFGHAGRDAMLREAADVWWPRIHREIVEKAKSCQQCSQSGKNIKCLQSQN